MTCADLGTALAGATQGTDDLANMITMLANMAITVEAHSRPCITPTASILFTTPCSSCIIVPSCCLVCLHASFTYRRWSPWQRHISSLLTNMNDHVGENDFMTWFVGKHECHVGEHASKLFSLAMSTAPYTHMNDRIWIKAWPLGVQKPSGSSSSHSASLWCSYHRPYLPDHVGKHGW